MLTTRPALKPHLPILQRTPDEVQLGLGSDGMILRGVSAALVGFLRNANGALDVLELAEATGAPVAEIRWAIEKLSRAHLLCEPEPATTTPAASTTPTIRLIGSGTLAMRFAEAYLFEQVGDLTIVDPEPAQHGLYEHARPTGAGALRAHLRARGHDNVSVANHWYRPEGPQPTLTLIANDRLECDRAITETLLRTDQPHLFIRPQEAGVVIGPLVVPGLTACTRCLDLVRGKDPAWPRLMAQLCHTLRPTDPVLAGWAAGTALLQVQSWLVGETPECLGSTLEVRRGRWVIEQRHWPRHPDCGCTTIPGI